MHGRFIFTNSFSELFRKFFRFGIAGMKKIIRLLLSIIRCFISFRFGFSFWFGFVLMILPFRSTSSGFHFRLVYPSDKPDGRTAIPTKAPVPAARSRFSQSSSVTSTTSATVKQRDVTDSEDELVVDLAMFSPKKPDNGPDVVQQQLQLQAAQKAEAERRKTEEEQKRRERDEDRKKMDKMLAKERTGLEKTVAADEGDKPPQPSRRKQWSLPPEMRLELSVTTPEEPVVAPPRSSQHKLKAGGVSPTSSGSEFFSLSEDEADEKQKSSATPDKSDSDDPDKAFAAMCVALARRKNQRIAIEDDDDEDTNKEDSVNAFWRRSSSDRGAALLSPAAQSLTTSARRSSSFDGTGGQATKRGSSAAADPLHFPSLSNTRLTDFHHL